MAKKIKVKTPDWILEGYDSKEDYEKAKGIKKENKSAKTFKIKRCPKCGSDDVKVVIGEVGVWKCQKCGWKGKNVKEEKLNEDEMMKYLSDTSVTDLLNSSSNTDSPNGSDEKENIK